MLDMMNGISGALDKLPHLSQNGFKDKPLHLSQNGFKDKFPHQCLEGVMGKDELGIMQLRDKIAQQVEVPGFDWKALEVMPVRNLFSMAKEEKLLSKDAKANMDESLLSAVKDGGLSEKKLVTIVLAFQRWRHSQLKNIIGQELRKVLEEAREDESVVASLSEELKHMEQQLANAWANSCKFQNQLMIQENDNAIVTALKGSKEADEEIQLKERQIEQLKEKIRILEEQMGMNDTQLRCLQSERSELQVENSIVLRENKELSEQLACKDNEVTKQVEEMKKLKFLAAKLVEQQSSRDFHTHSQLANISHELELTTSGEHSRHEKNNLLLKLHEAEKRVDLASTHAEELCAKLNCTTDNEGSALAAVEMVKHLKKLTQHVQKLKSSIDARDTSPSYGREDIDGKHTTECVAWKWRWAASSARAELLARKLHGIKDPNQQKMQDHIRTLTMKHLENGDNMTGHKLKPAVVLAAWRSFTLCSALQRKAASRCAILGKMLEALPWWMRRMRGRRQLERAFYQWLVLTRSHYHRLINCKEASTAAMATKVIPPRGGGASEETGLGRRIVHVKQRRSSHVPSDSKTRALQTLQITLQHEVGELKKILCQDVQDLQRNSQIKGRLVTAPTASSFAKQRQPDGKKVLKSVLGVCNNLALALTNVKGKLSPHVRANTLTPKAKLSPRILADTVNSCIRSEQTKINLKGAGSTSLPKPRSRLTAAPLVIMDPCCKNHMKNTTCIERHTTDLVMDKGAKNTSLKEKKLIESALARLVSTKISKLRQTQ